MTPGRKRIAFLVVLALLTVGLAAAGLRMRDQGQLRQRRQMLSGLGLACKIYAGDHGGAHPNDLRTLFPRYVNGPSYLAYATNAVEYFPNAAEASDPTTVLMRERRPDSRRRRWVCHADCSVELDRSVSP